jgi:hypothetical protein
MQLRYLLSLLVLLAGGNGVIQCEDPVNPLATTERAASKLRNTLTPEEISKLEPDQARKYTRVFLWEDDYAQYYTRRMAHEGYRVPKDHCIGVPKEALATFLKEKHNLDLQAPIFLTYVENALMYQFYKMHKEFKEKDFEKPGKFWWTIRRTAIYTYC